MPRVTITIPDSVYNALKERAKVNYRTINNQIKYELQQLVDNSAQKSTPVFIPDTISPTIPTKPPVITSIADTRPQAQTQTQIQTQTQNHKSFRELSEKILGHVLDETDYALTPDNTYYPYAKEMEGKFLRYADTMPYEKQVEYLEEYKHYDE